ncbi:MAG: hypothetical protein Q4B99_03620 [Clostridia bacterium]|nr:hypothetical protein [Clostridia bacterium]
MRAKENEREKTVRLYELFGEYMDEYAMEWERMERCEKLYRGEHWDEIPMEDSREPRPVTPIVFSTIENIKADLMDAMPAAVVTADEPKHAELAGRLTRIVAENHAASHYETEYARMLHDLLVCGMMVQETGFDMERNAGAGGAFIRHVDCRGIMFDPYCEDIQDSRAIFRFTPYRREWFAQRYPDKAPLMEADNYRLNRRREGFCEGGGDVILLIECWEREYDEATGAYCVHMFKLAGRVLLEDSRQVKPQGYYAHGRYPFVATALYRRKGTHLGFGLADMFANQQQMSDKLDQIVLKNALLASHNKLLVTGASGFDPDDLRDWAKEVHRGDSLTGVSWFSTSPLPAYIIDYIAAMRESIKEESGSNDFSRGNTAGGVTAAAAIAALQEMSGKRSRMISRSVHAAFEEAVNLELETEAEFSFIGEAAGGLPLGLKVSVRAHKANRFSVLSHNELVLNLVKLGMIAPDAGLELLLFDGKEQALELTRGAKRGSAV